MKVDIQFIKLKTKAILPYLILALIVFTIKLFIIANYGNATPFWDSWNGETIKLSPQFKILGIIKK